MHVHVHVHVCNCRCMCSCAWMHVLRCMHHVCEDSQLPVLTFATRGDLKFRKKVSANGWLSALSHAEYPLMQYRWPYLLQPSLCFFTYCMLANNNAFLSVSRTCTMRIKTHWACPSIRLFFCPRSSVLFNQQKRTCRSSDAHVAADRTFGRCYRDYSRRSSAWILQKYAMCFFADLFGCKHFSVFA